MKIRGENMQAIANMVQEMADTVDKQLNRIEEMELQIDKMELQIEKLMELIETKNDAISELTKELDSANDETLRLENAISDLKCVYEREVM